MKYRLLRGRFNRIERGVLVRYLPDSDNSIVDLSEEEAKKLASLIGPVAQKVVPAATPSKPPQFRSGYPVRN